jgi:hypothetical protein
MSSNHLETRMIHVRRKHHWPHPRRRPQAHNDISKAVTPKIQPVLGTNGFNLLTNAMLVVSHCRMQHQPPRQFPNHRLFVDAPAG